MDRLKYFRIPYVHEGRDFSGADCWGLVILYYREELGIELPDYKGAPAYRDWCDSRYILEAADTLSELFSSVDVTQAQPGDVVVICANSRVPNHIGVCLDNKEFLHTLDGHGPAVSRLSTWRRRVHKLYRHKG